jgi:hypothetical protein
MSGIIERDRSVIVACDVPYEKFSELVRKTNSVDGIGGYKLPLRSGRKGWETWIETAREHTEKPLILDGQKLGNDIPATGPGILEDIQGAVLMLQFYFHLQDLLYNMSGQELHKTWDFL